MKLQRYVSSLRKFRVWHRWVGVCLALFLLVSALTGILLAFKKDIAILQPPTQRGAERSLDNWLHLDTLSSLSILAVRAHRPHLQSAGIQRIDVRPAKGIAKVLFNQGNWEVQIDGVSGEVLSVAQRHSDWIESLHDGSIVSDAFKLGSMSALGIGVMILVSTGLWLWYGPRRVRAIKRKQESLR